jgi:preprotein translocase subunit SecD
MTELAAALPRIDRAIVASGIASAVPGEAGAAAQPAATPDLGLFGANQADSASLDTTTVASTDTVAGSQPFSSRLQPGSAGTDAIFLVTREDVPLLTRYLQLPEVQSAIPRNVRLRWGRQEEVAPGQPAEYRLLYALEADPLITGDFLVDAQAQRDQQMMPIVNFQFNRRGGSIFGRGTGANVGRLMAIVLDDNVVSAPVIQSQIGARGMIELGGGSIEEAGDLALVLRAGALPAPIEVVYQTSIGPTLGQDSIDRGLFAGVTGILVVILIIVGFYRFSGLMAITALAVYILRLAVHPAEH